MSRFVLMRQDGKETLIKEAKIKEEEHLQEVIKSNPQLIPVEDLGLGELLVVGRETGLPSGSVDLLCVDQNGWIVIVEFKKGPENSDHRRVIAQLLDYGAYLWQMNFTEFERKAVDYFNGKGCSNDLVKGSQNLREAYEKVWGSPNRHDEGEEPEWESFLETLINCLKTGEFYYLIISRQVDAVTYRVIDYLNSLSSFKIAAIEIDYFKQEKQEIFVPRVIFNRSRSKPRYTKPKTSENEFLDKLDMNTRQVFERLMEKVKEHDETIIQWGTVGFSYRVYYRGKPISILWGYPIESKGQGMGLLEFALPYKDGMPEVNEILEEYSKKIESEIDSLHKTSTLLQAKVPKQINMKNIDRIMKIIGETVDKLRAL